MSGATPGSGSTTWIGFLRAVNVGGRKVEMARLRELLTGMGLDRVRSYIASGNVFFDSELDPGSARARAELTAAVEQRLEQEFGFAIPTVLRTVAEVEAALAAAPFADIEVTPEIRLSIAFLSGPLVGAELPLRSPKGDWELLAATDGEAFVLSRLQDGRLGANPVAAVEKTFGVTATARFFHTTEKIVAAAKKR